MNEKRTSTAVPILVIGAAWGVFEATAGYFLHLLPISIGFLVWYPAAVFFLTASYRVTGKRHAILFTAMLASAIKLLNLLLPGPVDRVINPAVSILLEGMALFAAISALDGAGRIGKLSVSMAMNTAWRALYIGYLALLAPDTILGASVLKSGGELLRFFVIDNLASSIVIWFGLLLGERVLGLPKILRKFGGLSRI